MDHADRLTGRRAPAPRTPGVAAALRFIAAVREEPQLRARVAAETLGAGLAGVVRIAGEAGFAFSVQDLRLAHAHDWGLRRMRYERGAARAESADTTVAVVNSPSSST